MGGNSKGKVGKRVKSSVGTREASPNVGHGVMVGKGVNTLGVLVGNLVVKVGPGDGGTMSGVGGGVAIDGGFVAGRLVGDLVAVTDNSVTSPLASILIIRPCARRA